MGRRVLRADVEDHLLGLELPGGDDVDPAAAHKGRDLVALEGGTRRRVDHRPGILPRAAPTAPPQRRRSRLTPVGGSDARRKVPSVDALLRSAPGQRAARVVGRPVLKRTLTTELDAVRAAAADGHRAPARRRDPGGGGGRRDAGGHRTDRRDQRHRRDPPHQPRARAARPPARSRPSRRRPPATRDLEVDRTTGARGSRGSRGPSSCSRRSPAPRPRSS